MGRYHIGVVLSVPPIASRQPRGNTYGFRWPQECETPQIARLTLVLLVPTPRAAIPARFAVVQRLCRWIPGPGARMRAMQQLARFWGRELPPAPGACSRILLDVRLHQDQLHGRPQGHQGRCIAAVRHIPGPSCRKIKELGRAHISQGARGGPPWSHRLVL
jgi:hypothetical protein